MSSDKKQPTAAADPQAPKQVRSEDLFGGGRMVVIIHSGVQYRLTITRNDKLILQK